MGLAWSEGNGQPQSLADFQLESRNFMRLRVKLRDGFSGDTVSITVNGREIYRKSGVSTDLTISYADAVEIDVAEPVIKLEVSVEGGQNKAKEIRVQDTPFVDVWVIEGKMELRESRDETPML
jgi:hypothetical protein